MMLISRDTKSGVLVALLCLAGIDAPMAQGVSGSVDAGRRAYLRVGCDACHGTVGHGGAAPRLAPDVLSLAALTAWVRNGTPGWSIARGMPAFPDTALTDADLEDILAYLESIPAPPPLEDLPLLDLEPFQQP